MRSVVRLLRTVIKHRKGPSQPISLPDHPHIRPVRLRRLLLLAVHVTVGAILKIADANPRNHQQYISNGTLPSRRPYIFKYCHFQDTSQHRSYHQGEYCVDYSGKVPYRMTARLCHHYSPLLPTLCSLALAIQRKHMYHSCR